MMTPLFYGCNVKILLEKCKYYVEIPLENYKFNRKLRMYCLEFFTVSSDYCLYKFKKYLIIALCF